MFDPNGAGTNIDLGALGGSWGRALSLNEAGQIVGCAHDPAGLIPHGRACLFDPGGIGGNVDLGTLGGHDSAANSINDAGQIVGSAYNSEAYLRATLFDPTGAGNNIDLNTLIDPASGWTLTTAYEINASGWIVGKGINAQGGKNAFLLIPEPATFALLAAGLLCLRKRTRHS